MNTATLGNTTAAIRSTLACADTSNNSLDFNVLPPTPRNSASPVNTCSCSGGGSTNVTNTGLGNGEVAYCLVQFPSSTMTVPALAQVPPASTGVGFVYGRFFSAGKLGGAVPEVRAEVGVGPTYLSPFTQYVFYPAAFNVVVDGNDEWQRAFPAPALAGSYNVVYRFSVDNGAKWTYCDLQGNGGNSLSSGGPDPLLLPFDAANLLPLVVP
jgi:hypothetical protein